ncbi:MAG: hypothetical protein ACHP6H_04015 [Legionellales bacterium]
MDSLINLFSMEGYGAYVWGSVLLTMGILVGNAWYANYQLRCAQKEWMGKL